MQLTLNHSNKTRKLGNWLAEYLVPGDLVLLSGELGAGKTTFAQGVAEGLGVIGYVPSPTFIIVHEHVGIYPLFHIDLYRLNHPSEFSDLAVHEMLERGIVLVEWPEMAGQYIGDDYLKITFEYQSETSRMIEFTRINDRFRKIFKEFDPLAIQQ